MALLADRLDQPFAVQSTQQTLLVAEITLGRVLLGDLLGQSFQESLAAQEPAVPSFGPRGGGRGGQAGGDKAPVRRLGIGPPELPGSGRQKCLVSYPVDTVAAAEISGTA